MLDFRSLVLRAGSIRSAARLLRVSPRAVSRWYAGREVPPGVAERLAAELGATADLGPLNAALANLPPTIGPDFIQTLRDQDPGLFDRALAEREPHADA